MKNLKYSEVTHSPRYDYSDAGVPKYATDWNRNEERFKVTGNGAIRVYQGGRVEIIRTPYRAPDLKALLCKSYDVDFRLPGQETPGIKFFTPDGRPVVKNHLVDGMLLFDHEHKMALAGRNFHYVERGYAPKSNKQITVKVWQPEKEAAFLEEWGDTLKLGVTMAALGGRTINYGTVGLLRQWLRTPKPLDPVQDKITLEYLGIARTNLPTQFATALREVCAKAETFDYLRIEEK